MSNDLEKLSPLPARQRIDWLDVSRGLAILIVVFGHSGVSWVNPYISWVQIPFFFVIGGLTFRNAKEKHTGNFLWSVSKIKALALPYVIFGALTYWVFLAINPSFVPPKRDLLFGGIKLGGIYGVYWFITVYLFTLLVFNFISQVKMRNIQIAIVAVMYLAGHALAVTADQPMVVLWNLDVVLVTTAFFAVGYYAQEMIDLVTSYRALFISGGLLFIIFLLQYKGAIDLRMDMKYKEYSNPVLDFIVPLTVVSFFMSLARNYEKHVSVFKYFGRASLYIMFIHIPINKALFTIFEYNVHPIALVVIGMILPTIVYFLVHTKVVSKLTFNQIKTEKISSNV